MFQLVKATQLSADKFTVSEIKAVKRVEKAWLNGEIDSFPALLSLFTDIEAAGDLRTVAEPWTSPDGGSASSSGFLGSSSLDKRSAGGQGGGNTSSSGWFDQRTHDYRNLPIPSAVYPGKIEFVAESISKYDFCQAFEFVDTGSYCGKTWRAKLDGPRLDISSFFGARAKQALGTFGALKYAQRAKQYETNHKGSNIRMDNPTYIAELAYAKTLPFKPHPASPSLTDAEEAEATKLFP